MTTDAVKNLVELAIFLFAVFVGVAMITRGLTQIVANDWSGLVVGGFGLYVFDRNLERVKQRWERA